MFSSESGISLPSVNGLAGEGLALEKLLSNVFEALGEPETPAVLGFTGYGLSKWSNFYTRNGFSSCVLPRG